MSNDAPYKSYLESLLNALGDVVIFLSPDGIINEFSPLMETYFSWELDSMRGKSFDDLFQMTQRPTPFSLADYKSMRHKGITIDTLTHLGNKKIHLSWAWVPLNSSPGFMIIGRDISEIKKLDIHHRTLNAQLEKISTCVPGNFYWKNTKAQYLGCNDTLLKTLGLDSMNEIIGKTDKDLWPEQEEKLRENDQLVIQTGETLFLEEKVTMPGKGDRYFTVIKMPLLDEEGNIIGILGNSLDITELKNTQAELQIAIERAEAANHAKTEFIANMGHDIRTPLTGIIGFSHYLEDHIKDLEEKECAKQIHESGEQLLGLLNSVLDMITADSTNDDNICGEPFDLHELVQDVLELELPAIQAHHLSIETHLEGVVPHYVIGDKMKLHRILLNLAGNAIKFTKVGHIELNAKLISQDRDIATIEFQVKDTGIGIPKELQDKVFDRFFKISPSYKGLYTGNGIGLHIAQKYVELLGGQLTLKSQEGVGTTFSFILKLKLGSTKSIAQEREKVPLVNQPIPELNTAQLPELPLTIKTLDPHQLRVLLVEDNLSALKILQMMMEPYSTEIQTAGDAEYAFLLVQQQPFDLIITDIGLPNKNGDELTRDIRGFEKEHHRTSCIIVGLTGHSLGEITQRCLDAGMNMVYRKPMTADPLQTLMARFLSQDEENPNSDSRTDLPATTDELFTLDVFPLLDIDLAIKLLGNERMAREVLKTLIEKGISPDLNALDHAYTTKDWVTIGKLIHKMKAGTVYGTVQLHYALLYLERSIKAGYSDYLEDLYDQLIHVIDETNIYLNSWLNKEPKSTTKEHPPSSISRYLEDLPVNTQSLFKLDEFPLLDISIALKCVGNETALIEVLTLMKDKSVPEDLSSMSKAYAIKDWDKVQQMAHKIKSGAVYAGTVRMKMACQYLERYWKTGQRELLEELYSQALMIIHHTMIHIGEWLNDKPCPGDI